MKSISYEELLDYISPEYKFLAMDEDGEVCAFKTKPQAHAERWSLGGKWESASVFNITNKPKDWKESLRERPEPDEIPDENTPWGTPVEVRDGLEQEWKAGIFVKYTSLGSYEAILVDSDCSDVWEYCRIKKGSK